MSSRNLTATEIQLRKQASMWKLGAIQDAHNSLLRQQLDTVAIQASPPILSSHDPDSFCVTELASCLWRCYHPSTVRKSAPHPYCRLYEPCHPLPFLREPRYVSHGFSSERVSPGMFSRGELFGREYGGSLGNASLLSQPLSSPHIVDNNPLNIQSNPHDKVMSMDLSELEKRILTGVTKK